MTSCKYGVISPTRKLNAQFVCDAGERSDMIASAQVEGAYGS